MRRVESLTEFEDDVAVVDVTGRNIDAGPGRLRIRKQRGRNTSTSPLLSGGDPDAQWEMDELYGDEAAGGSMMTPDQNVVDELGAALGSTYDDDEELWCGTRQSDRDRHRWELDPASAEDYAERWRK